MNNMQSPQLANAQARTNAAAGWFTAIAAFSIINALIGMIGTKIHFIIGLALCELIDDFGQSAGTGGKVIAFVVDLAIAAIWWFFATQGKKGARWAFIVGMIFYALDGVVFLVGQDWLAGAFHAYVLFRLFPGFAAAGELSALKAQTAQSGAWYGGAPQQPGAWPPAPGQPPQPGQWPSTPGQPQQPGQWPQQPTPPQAGGWPQQPPQPQPGWPQQPSTPQFGGPPAPQPPYPPTASAPPVVGSPSPPTTDDWSQPAPPQSLPSHWPAPAQPQPQPAPEAES